MHTALLSSGADSLVSELINGAVINGECYQTYPCQVANSRSSRKFSKMCDETIVNPTASDLVCYA